MGEVVTIAEGRRPRVGFPKSNEANAATYLVARLFTDAVFNQDIRSIMTIINRIDGGLPKDVDKENYQTEFGDCINELLTMKEVERLKVMPDDSVMMAMCKSLYDLAVQDIYWDGNKGRMRKPTTEDKNSRDTAMRIILERAGGRKTVTPVVEQKEELETADWIKNLPKLTS